MSQSDCPMCAPQVFFNTRPIPFCYPIDTLNRPEVCAELAHGRMCPPFAIDRPHDHPPPPGERGNLPHRRPPREHEGYMPLGSGHVRGAAACLTCPGNVGPFDMRRYATIWALLKSIPDGYGPWGYGYSWGAPFPQSRCNKANFFPIPQWPAGLPPSAGPVAGQVAQARQDQSRARDQGQPPPQYSIIPSLTFSPANPEQPAEPPAEEKKGMSTGAVVGLLILGVAGGVAAGFALNKK
jgi:hypothetical protein